ncbi:MAG: hypothetical protein DHS20C02_00900 [Micavibrio sp.]|nr:MAG: hypothetical protein DHS20C02_00900 [Micavibrio sp.]
MNEKNKKQETKKKDMRETADDLIKGKYRLIEVFWLYYFVPVLVLNTLGTALGGLLAVLLNLVALLWAGFMVIPIWKSADNYKGNKALAILAKIVAVLVGLKVALSFPV